MFDEYNSKSFDFCLATAAVAMGGIRRVLMVKIVKTLGKSIVSGELLRKMVRIAGLEGAAFFMGNFTD